MNLYEYSSNPLYIDRALSNPNWAKVLFGSRPIQASELIEIQTIQQQNIHRSLSTIFKNGSVIKGFSPIVRDLGTDIELQFTAGVFYIDGFCLEIEGTSFTISKEGTHHVHILLEEKIITELEDPNLRDTNTGGSLYGTEGAARLLWQGSLVLNSPTEFLLATIKEGVVISNTHHKDDTKDRTIYERYGDFVLEGLVPSIKVQPTNSSILLSDETSELKVQLTFNKAEERRQRSVLESLTKEQEYLISYTNPSHDIIKRREDLYTLIEEKKDLLSQLINSITSIESQLYKATSNNSNQVNSSGVNYFTKVITITPGSAYVGGAKVEKESLTQLIYTHELEELVVEGLPFTHIKNLPFNHRMLSYGTQIRNFKEAARMGFTLYLNFSNLSWGSDKVIVRVSITYNRDTTITSLSELVEDIVSQLSSIEAIETGVTYNTSFGRDLSPYLLRSILQNNIKLSVTDSNTIAFESLSQNDISITTRSSNDLIIFDKEVTYINHLSSNEVRTYYLGEDVKSIQSLIAVKKESDYPITKSSVHKGVDPLPDDSILSILSLSQGEQTYIEGKDFLLRNNSIDWNTGVDDSIRPEPGTTYYVKFLYSTNIREYDIKDGFLRFTNEEPETGTTFYVTYTRYVPLTTNLYIKEDGEFVLSSLENEGLLLSSIRLTSTTGTVSIKANRKWTSLEIENLKNEIDSNRDSIKLLMDSIRYEDTSYLTAMSYIDESVSKYDINAASYSLSQPSKREDISMGNEVLTLSYSISQYLREGSPTNHIDIALQECEVGRLSISPSTVFINDDIDHSIPYISNEAKESWFIESDVRSYIKDRATDVKYEIEHAMPVPNDFVSGKVQVHLKAIGLPAKIRGFSIYIDNIKVDQRDYLLNDNSISIGSFLSSNEEGVIDLSIAVDLKVGSHIVEITNGEYSSSSFISVMDVKKITNFISASTIWDKPLVYKARLLPKYPANRKTEMIPPVIQEFRLRESIFIKSLAIAVKSGDLEVVIGKSDDRGPTPSFITRGTYSRTLNNLRHFELEDAVLLEKDKTYYIGLIYRDINVYPYISRISERSIDSSLVITGPSHSKDLMITDGFKGNYLEGTTLVYEINQMLFKPERLIEVGSFESTDNIKAFSINSRVICPPNTEAIFYYRKDGSLIRVSPFVINRLDTPVKKLDLLVRLRGNISSTPMVDLSESSVSLFTGPISPLVLIQSVPIPFNNEFSQVVVEIEYMGEPAEEVHISLDEGSTWSALELESTLSTKYSLLIDRYSIDSVSNSTNTIMYRVASHSSSSTQIRDIRISTNNV